MMSDALGYADRLTSFEPLAEAVCTRIADIHRSAQSSAAKRRSYAVLHALICRVLENLVSIPEFPPVADESRGAGLEEAGIVSGMAVATEEGVIPNCTIIRAGLNGVGTRFYTPEFLQAHLDAFEGGLSYLDHPTADEARQRPERSLTTLAGTVSRVRWDDKEQSVKGDITLLMQTPAGKQVYETFQSDAVRQMAGLSIYWPHAVESAWEMRDGNRVQVPLKLVGPPTAKVSTDFVTGPTAGGKVGNIGR